MVGTVWYRGSRVIQGLKSNPYAELSHQKNFVTKEQADNEITGRIFAYGTKLVS
jgi:hypothetical protein